MILWIVLFQNLLLAIKVHSSPILCFPERHAVVTGKEVFFT